MQDEQMGVDDQEVIPEEQKIEQEEQPQAESEPLDDGEEEITIGQPEAPAGESEESPTIRQMRQALREKTRRERELAQELERTRQTAQQQLPPETPKPTLEQFGYDEYAYENALATWYENKRIRDGVIQQQKARQEEENRAYQVRLADYQQKAMSLPVNRQAFKDAEEEVISKMNPIQQTVILKSPVAERLVYAVGRDTSTLERLSKIQDPVELAMELGRIETKLVATKKTRAAPPPESTVRSGSGSNSTLDALYAEGQKSGDFTKYFDAKRKMGKK